MLGSHEYKFHQAVRYNYLHVLGDSNLGGLCWNLKYKPTIHVACCLYASILLILIIQTTSRPDYYGPNNHMVQRQEHFSVIQECFGTLEFSQNKWLILIWCHIPEDFSSHGLNVVPQRKHRWKQID